ncbi:ABC transporter ATP-binding protein [Brevibacterium zhoupengii]|uniref:ABC transporter ATP-binding protein n=1 Tax=Brevibacterium zhoupengii TaxID=2898795 RepID=UPI001E5EE6E8|nr:ABC transporter ATP-binding protein [Brevibacterium zhoupengii]
MAPDTLTSTTPAPGAEQRAEGIAEVDRPLVRVRDLTRRFGSRTVLDSIDVDIAAGEFVALLGRSGSGKSTLLRALAGLDKEVGGQVDVPASRSVAFQDSRLLPWQRVLPNVTLGLRGDRPVERASAALAEVGLSGREKSWPKELSGGEQQRVSLARALVREPELLLADEPFGALDALTKTKMHGLLHELLSTHRPAVLLVTHDIDEALLLADRILVLDTGRISHDVRVPAAHPRSLFDPEVTELRRTLLQALGVDASV